jgi:cell division protease FtsH
MSQAKKPNSLNSLKLQKKKPATPGPKKQLTRSQRILRGPLFWIIAAIIGVTVFGQITNAGNQYTQIKTSQALDAIAKSDVESAVLIDKIKNFASN